MPQIESLAGNYSSNINVSNVEFRFTNMSMSIVGGCNMINGIYFAYSNGTINFKIFSSTLMRCANDKDSIYV
jgi:heat shock protein HslJ